jgi:hypothetical protein
MKLTTVIPAVLNRIRPGSTFMSVMGYENNWGEVSNFGLVFHADYLMAVRKAIITWMTYKPRDQHEALAHLQLMRSYQDTLRGYNPRHKVGHVYEPITDGQDVLVRGTKWYKNGQEVHVTGFRVHKAVLRPGVYPDTLQSPFALAKRRLLGMTPLGNFRQFKIIEGRFDHIGVEKLSLTHHDLLRELT